MGAGPGQPLGALAPRRVPEAYVRAEVASFPLASLTAFQEAVTVLNPTLDGEAGLPTRKLWRDCERMLSEHGSGWSLDRLIAMRDLFWFTGSRGPKSEHLLLPSVPMHRYLWNLSNTHLEPRPGVTIVAQSTESDAMDALAHYRWLTFALPEDLLLAAVPVEPPPTRVVIEPPLLVRRLLDRGVTEIHHHVGAGMDFPLLWASALSALSDRRLPTDALTGPGLPFRDGKLLLRWLLAAAIARCVLAEHLLRGEGRPLKPFLEDLVHGPWSSRAWTPQRQRVLWLSLEALSLGDSALLPGFEALQALYAELHPLAGPNASDPPATLDEAWRRCDPIAVRLGLHTPNGGERWLMRGGLARLKKLEAEGTQDAAFTRLFWQGVRLRCVCYRAYVQRPMTAGLQWFIRFYGRLAYMREPLRAARTEVSYRVAGGDQPIAALEARTSLGDHSIGTAEELRQLLRSWRHVLARTRRASGTGRQPEFGVVLHLSKGRDPEDRWREGLPPAYGMGTYAEPRPRGRVQLGGRYSDYFVRESGKVQGLVHLLKVKPLLAWLVRGLDVASDELSVPTWVLVPLFRYVQTGVARAAARSASRNAPPLRMTAHVGEDFRHLLEGLRRVYECLHYLLDRSGGRMGHAIALGVDPRSWAESMGAVMMPAEERLWDLVFEWRLYSNYRLPMALAAEAPPTRAQQVENGIHELSELVFGYSCEPHVLAEAHHVLHQLWCPPLLRTEVAVGLDAFTRALQRASWHQVHYHEEVRRLLHQYREDEATFQRGQRLVDIILDASEVAALRAVQDALRECVAVRGIVVEVNPSSNLLIGDMMDLRNHPILRLFPPGPREEGSPPVPIAVGADDPVTFSTFLVREYSLLYETARAAGYPERVVQEWLAAIQQTSMDARFTAPWMPTAEAMTEDLLRELDDFLKYPSQTGSRGG
jgi:hypothetical protein